MQITVPGKKLINGENASKRMHTSAVKEVALREGHPSDTPLLLSCRPHQPAPPYAQPVENNALNPGILIDNIELLARPGALLIKRNARLDQRKINLV